VQVFAPLIDSGFVGSGGAVAATGATALGVGAAGGALVRAATPGLEDSGGAGAEGSGDAVADVAEGAGRGALPSTGRVVLTAHPPAMMSNEQSR
jgi:hypothetical protein